MSHFDECNIKAWEGAENPPPWCNCQTVAEIWIKTRSEVIAECIAAVEYLHDHEAPHDAHKDALWNAITALRALQEQP